MREMPKVSAEDADALEAAISAGRLPVDDEGIFDRNGVGRKMRLT
jgi:hypothetical protein